MYLIRKDMSEHTKDGKDNKRTPVEPVEAQEQQPAPVVSEKEIPDGYWKCPHCDALNEIENRTGACSSCHKEVD